MHDEKRKNHRFYAAYNCCITKFYNCRTIGCINRIYVYLNRSELIKLPSIWTNFVVNEVTIILDWMNYSEIKRESIFCNL